VSLRRSGVTLLPLGLRGISKDVGREDDVLFRLVPLIPDHRRGVWGRDGAVDGAVGVSCGATDEARDPDGEAVVDRSVGGVEGARDQPNNDVRMAVDDGPVGGDGLVIGGSSLAISEHVCSLMEGSTSTDAMTPNRPFTCVEDFKKGIR